MSSTTTTEKHSANLTSVAMTNALPRLKKRHEELSALELRKLTNENGYTVLESFQTKINATLRHVFGADSLEYEEYKVGSFFPHFVFFSSETDFSFYGNFDSVKKKVMDVLLRLSTIIEIFEERIEEVLEDQSGRVLKAYGGLELHPEIARAASKLYQDGHYANAVEASVKALNGLVRLRSGLEQDGTILMEQAFSPKKPKLKFNALENQSDKDEQLGFQMLFKGAVSGLRNPRAHGFIEDDPERALEFIAFTSLLAKLLDNATPEH